MEEGEYRYNAEDVDVEDEALADSEDSDVQEEDPCGGYMPPMDGDEDEDGGGTFGTSRDVAMVA